MASATHSTGRPLSTDTRAAPPSAPAAVGRAVLGRRRRTVPPERARAPPPPLLLLVYNSLLTVHVHCAEGAGARGRRGGACTRLGRAAARSRRGARAGRPPAPPPPARAHGRACLSGFVVAGTGRSRSALCGQACKATCRPVSLCARARHARCHAQLRACSAACVSCCTRADWPGPPARRPRPPRSTSPRGSPRTRGLPPRRAHLTTAPQTRERRWGGGAPAARARVAPRALSTSQAARTLRWCSSSDVRMKRS